MDKLWAPWRIKYIRSKKQRGCIFCPDKKGKCENYVFMRSEYSFAMLNTFPYNNGHVMVSPIRHVKDISLLKDAELLDLIRTLNRAKALLEKVLKPHGFNIGINISRSAGAGVLGHVHIHIVPRWVGDTNFMPVLAQTKVVSQSLDELFKRLKNAQR